jgi:hypothetical protein
MVLGTSMTIYCVQKETHMISIKNIALKEIVPCAVFQHYNYALVKWTIVLKKQFHCVALKRFEWGD